MTRFVVKSRRIYNGVEATSVLTPPSSKWYCELYLRELNEQYQEPGNFYIEEWRESA